MTNKNHQYIPLIKAYTDRCKSSKKLKDAFLSILWYWVVDPLEISPTDNAVYQFFCKKWWSTRYFPFHNLDKYWFDRTVDEKDMIDIGYRVKNKDGTYRVNKEIDLATAKSYKRYDTYEEVMNLYYPETE